MSGDFEHSRVQHDQTSRLRKRRHRWNEVAGDVTDAAASPRCACIPQPPRRRNPSCPPSLAPRTSRWEARSKGGSLPSVKGPLCRHVVPPLTSVAHCSAAPAAGRTVVVQRSALRTPVPVHLCTGVGRVCPLVGVPPLLLWISSHTATSPRPDRCNPQDESPAARGVPLSLRSGHHRCIDPPTGGTSNGQQAQHPQHQVHDRDHEDQALVEGNIGQPSLSYLEYGIW